MAEMGEGELDVLLLVPTPTQDAYLLDPLLRQTYGPSGAKIQAAAADLEAFVGRDLGIGGSVYAGIDNPQRSLTAVALATHLQRAGLRWAVVDPGSRDIGYWADKLRQYQARRPRCVAISTTYFVTGAWLEALITTIRRICPQAAVIAGGYMYGTKAREFLALSADVLATGDGEERLPQIVRAIRDRRALDLIPGLYVRDVRGALRFTGSPEPLDIEQLAMPDWSLAALIDPPVNPQSSAIGMAVETQRGCVFKCEFCTFRTLSTLNVMSPERAVEALFNTAIFGDGYILLTDATATFPHDRWRRIMELLIERGGAPHPIWAFARVSDLNPGVVALMRRANVGALFIGQESGDQRILSAMRKGTQISHVAPAVASLAGSRIHTTFGFIHGFPSETAESMRATRDMICRLNDGFEAAPPVQQYTLSPFSPQDLASVSTSERLKAAAVPAKVAIEETLVTFIAVARALHAPASNYVGFSGADARASFLPGASRDSLFRWTKLLQLGVAEFLERDLEGRPIDEALLRRIRDALVRDIAPAARSLPRLAKAGRRVRAALLRRLGNEFGRDETREIGPLTRVLLWLSVLRHYVGVVDTLQLLRALEQNLVGVGRNEDVTLDHMANDLATRAIEAPRRELAGGKAKRYLARVH